MKYTYVLAVLLVVAVVAMAAAPDKAAKKAARKSAKDARKKCKPVSLSYSPCVDNKMTITKQPPSGVEGCTPATAEVQCITTQTKTKGSCTRTKKVDYTQCATPGGDLDTLKKVITVSYSGCSKTIPERTKEFPCSGFKGKKGSKKEGKDKKNGGNRCIYGRGEWSSCNGVTNVKTMRRPLKRGNPSVCEPFRVKEKVCKRSKRKTKGCKYRRGEWSECDGTTNIKTMVKTLKKGDTSTCPPTQVVEKICKRQHKGLRDKNCKYKKSGRWGQCDLSTGVKSREMNLFKGDPEKCPPKKTVTKNCRNKRKGKRKGCVYEKNPWGPCNAATNTVIRTLTLKEGDPAICNVTKIQEKKCKSRHLRPHVCKYRRTTWEECDPTTNMRVMIKTLKRGDPTHCEATQTVERKCKGKKNTNVCKYKYEEWSACNVTTNTMTRQQVLKSGPSTCPPVKEYSKKCKKPCKFETGEWSECNLSTNQMTRVDKLKKATDPSCPKTRVLTKKCGKNGKGCVYDRGTWSECDSSEKPQRTRTQKLVSGGPACQPEKKTTKSCTKRNGEVRCFFGPWSDYEECRNGVQKKRREVLQGGLECERKSVKIKAC